MSDTEDNIIVRYSKIFVEISETSTAAAALVITVVALVLLMLMSGLSVLLTGGAGSGVVTFFIGGAIFAMSSMFIGITK